MKVLVADAISERGLVKLREAGFEVDVRTGLAPERLKEIIGEYDALLVRSQTKVTAEIIAAAPRLKVIGRAGVGVDNVDVPAATARGIVVLNAPEGNTISTAEHTWALLMSVARMVPQACQSLKEGQWDRKSFVGVELSGKTLGVVGLGRVGGQVAKRALAFGMRVLAYDPYLSAERAEKLGVEVATVEQIVAEADFITVHTPLTPETRHLFGPEQFAKMKPGVRIVNCARGGIYDEEALLAALESGKVAGAALDVFEQEPPTNTALVRHPRVVVTPHLGASTVEAQENVAIDVAREVVNFLRGEPFKNAVNLPALPAEEAAEVRPYLGLCERIGRFAGQSLPGRIRRVELVYQGALATLPSAPLTAAAMKGLLDVILSEAVNAVNALYLAKQRGIKVAEVKEEQDGYANLFRLQVETDGGRVSLAGSLFGSGEPHIVSIDGYQLDVPASGHLLLTRHLDQPGMIGKVGTILGEAGVNIASMQVGRKVPGGEAVMVLGVDESVPSAVLERIAAVPGISGARLVSLD
ncbi:MAG TPA: phosphoglycerate dehydrogenase [Firmicutes bacterium]|nr:phosphoglycerate dehydrogenase [Bacillota bacterium]